MFDLYEQIRYSYFTVFVQRHLITLSYQYWRYKCATKYKVSKEHFYPTEPDTNPTLNFEKMSVSSE